MLSPSKADGCGWMFMTAFNAASVPQLLLITFTLALVTENPSPPLTWFANHTPHSDGSTSTPAALCPSSPPMYLKRKINACTGLSVAKVSTSSEYRSS